MLVDRHHTQYLIELGAQLRGKSASELDPERERLAAFLRTLRAAATPQALLAFEARMRDPSNADQPWSTVRVPDEATNTTASPPAAVLLLGAHDDDPDGEEDGNRLPARETPGWAALYAALEQWNPTQILAWIGPLGWQPPSSALGVPQDPELAGPPPPPTLAAAASLAAQEAAARSKQTLRVVGTAAAIGGASALLLGLGRALGR